MAAHSHHSLSIIEAVETLSSIADLENNHEAASIEQSEIVIGGKRVDRRKVHWLHEKDAPATVRLVKDTFRAVLKYLKQVSKSHLDESGDRSIIEGIKMIMVLVGEATKKLAKYAHVFNQNEKVTDLEEYKQLQSFYRTKIAHEHEDGMITQWVLGLTLGKEQIGRAHV